MLKLMNVFAINFWLQKTFLTFVTAVTKDDFYRFSIPKVFIFLIVVHLNLTCLRMNLAR